ncbi:MAG: tRNA (adenosine(37)-N6)-dimethylallyltransferase MiaA [Chloroflexi bacterium]|nr:tRNA (adenosine(37)-N6)-dimethylallyltransferase MiaA [Chloroflexota bacterium]
MPASNISAPRPRLVAVVGPTATGKTALAIHLARAFDGEVINSDSRLFYRGFDIGTAKPTAEELAAVPHHLVDFLDPIADPGDPFGLADYLDAAKEAIGKIIAQHGLPVLAGGAGQYVWGLLEGWNVPRVPPDPALRSKLAREAEEKGGEVVFARLEELDREAAERIDPRNVRRVIRAIEVARAGANKGPRRSDEPPYDALVIGLRLPREQLYARIDARIDRMLVDGWVDEVRAMVERGVPSSAPPMTSIGYREIAGYLAGERTYDDAVRAARRATRNLVRHQGNWFAAGDERINWLDAADPDRTAEAAIELVSSWMSETAAN